MKMRILAIDPGASGGLATVFPDGKVTADKMPDDADLKLFIGMFAAQGRAEGETPICFLEQVGGFVGGNPAPGSAMFNFGSGYGYIRGLLAAYDIETHLIRPQVWQAGIPGIKGEKDKPTRKRRLKEHAARLFPTISVTLCTADALCIADYAKRYVRQASI